MHTVYSSHQHLFHLPTIPASQSLSHIHVFFVLFCFVLGATEFVRESCVILGLELPVETWWESKVGTEGVSLSLVMYPNLTLLIIVLEHFSNLELYLNI